MKAIIKKSSLATLLLSSVLMSQSYAAAELTATTNISDLKLISGVRVSMQRMLKSSEGRYFMSLYAGINNPHGELYDLMDGTQIQLKGTQKGDQLSLNSIGDSTSSSAKNYQLVGTLNANTGLFKALLSEKTDTFGKSLTLEPAFKVANKPVFVFKFYGQNSPKQPLGNVIKRVDVLDKTNNNVVQSLTGYTAYAGSVGYMDINFDGYYDIILSDLSDGKLISDKRYIYWMYNPKTQQFQRSPQLEKIVGFPNLHGEKQQIDFGNGQIYQVEKGLLNRITDGN